MVGAGRVQQAWQSLPARAVVLGALVLSVLVGAVAAGWSASRSTQRQATAVVLLQPAEGNPFTPEGKGDDLVNLETEAQLVRSDAVGRAVEHNLRLTEDLQTLLGSVSVQVPANTQLLQISVRAGSAAIATERATAFAQAFLQYRRGRTETVIAERSARLEDLIRQRERDRSAAVARLAQLTPGTLEASLVNQQVRETTTHIGTLQEELTTAQATSLDPGQVVTPGTADPPSLLARPPLVGAAAAIATALVVLLLVTGARRARDSGTIWSIEDLAGIEPEAPTVLGQLDAPARPESEPVLVARSLLVNHGAAPPVSLMVGALSDGARSGLGRALAHALARARYEVIELDLQDPRTVDALCELLLGESSVGDVLHAHQPFLSGLVPVGEPETQRRADFADLAASANLPRILAELGKRADVVLLDTGPLLGRVGRALLPRTQAVVAESRAGATTVEEVRELLVSVDSAGARLVGVVNVRLPGDLRGPAHAAGQVGGAARG